MTNLTTALDSIRCNIPLKSEVGSILTAALEAADPFDAVTRNLQRDGNLLRIGDNAYAVPSDGKVVVVALGKAAPAMLQGAHTRLGALIERGVCISKHAVEVDERVDNIQYLVGDHPVPGVDSLAAGMALQQTVSSLGADDLVILLLSGGGSALAALLVEGISLADVQAMTTALLRSGATIKEMNAVRKHLDHLKGGGLLRLAAPARVAVLILSDVVGSPIDVIASGPACPDPSTFATSLKVVNQAAKFGAIPIPITDHLENGASGKIPETVKSTDPLLANATNMVIGSNLVSCSAAVEKARECGFFANLVTEQFTGEAREAGRYLAQFARDSIDLPRPYVLVFGGETTVTVSGNGKGGRNQELALAAAIGLAGLERCLIVTLATDGEDGPTDAAGAVVDGSTLERARSLGLDPKSYLLNNDAYTFFKKTGDLLVLGPTGTNVNDMSFIFGF